MSAHFMCAQSPLPKLFLRSFSVLQHSSAMPGSAQGLQLRPMQPGFLVTALNDSQGTVVVTSKQQRVLVVALLLFVLAIFPQQAICAAATGEIVGTVRDPTARLIPNAVVRIVNELTGAERFTHTGALGEYRVSLLPVGIYRVEVEKLGFRKLATENVRVDVDKTVRISFNLELGSIKESITVSAAPPLMETDTSEVGYVVGEHEVQDLPLNERNFLEFALLVPGVQMPAEGSQNIGTGGSFSINGAREQSNNFLVDGTDNNDPLVNEYAILPPLDAIDEFKVQASNSPAAFGRTAGAQINIVLKSGTNHLKGSAFEFIRNRHMDAKNYFDLPDCHAGSIPGTCAEIPALDRSQYGGSLGGPLRRNRSFFFVAYEGLHLRHASTRTAAVPSSDQRATALAAVPLPLQSPAGVAAMNLYPAANAGSDLATSNLLVSAPLSHTTRHQGLIKLDHGLTDRDTLSGHFGLYDQGGYQAFNPKFDFTNLPDYGEDEKLHGVNIGLDWTRAGPVFTNIARIGFSRRSTKYLQEGSGIPLNREIGFPDVSSEPVDWGYPNIIVPGFDGIGTAIVLPQDFTANTFEFGDDAVWNPPLYDGRHQFKFGADIRRVQENFYLDALKRGEWLFLGGFTGSPLQDLVAGLPTLAIATEGDTHTGLRATGIGLYFLDNLRLTQDIFLNAGLRYDYNSPATEIHNRLSVPDLSSDSASCSPKPACQFIVAGTDGVPRATYNSTLGDFAPRFGIAWRPFGSKTLVLRAAYGIYFDAGLLNVNLLPRSNPPFFSVNAYANFGMSNIQTIISPTTSLPVPVQSVLISPHYRDSYLQQWNFTVERQFAPDFVVSAAYLGSSGVHLLDQREGNQPAPQGQPPYPQFGEIRYISADSLSNYNSLQLRAEKRYGKGFSLLGAYTWSRSIDDSSSLFGSTGDTGFPQDSSNLRAERGLSNFHAEHRFVASAIYSLPAHLVVGSSWASRMANKLAAGWETSTIFQFQTGHPLTVYRGVDQSHTDVSVGFFDRPDAISDPFKAGPVMRNPDPACHLTVSAGGRAADATRTRSSWFNACAFAAPSTPRFGTAGRNTVIGPGLVSFDLQLMKSFSIGGERSLQFTIQAFNLLNHPNLDLPNNNFDSSTFVQVRSANSYGNKPPRQMQVGIRFEF